MCGRISLSVEPGALERFVELLASLGPLRLAGDWEGGERGPEQAVPLLRLGAEGLELRPALWGFPLQGRDPLINARAESVFERPRFREAARRRRAAVLAGAFYERDPDGRLHLYAREDGELLALAALWEPWTPPPTLFGQPPDELRCVLLTRPALPPVAEVHPRMPVVLGPDGLRCWLDLRSPLPELRHFLAGPPPELREHRPLHRSPTPRGPKGGGQGNHLFTFND